jgi:peptidyl-prolyl cis-trans isomerase B (cyclophilin B)
MTAKQISSDRRRSRPVTKRSKTKALKRNKPALALTILIVAMLVFSGVYVVFNSINWSNGSTDTGYENDPEYIAALNNTDYPVAVIETSKGAIAIELYNNNDQAPETCQNFINLVNDGFYDGMIFHRIDDDFMIQAGKNFPDESEAQSPYGSIAEFEGELSHVDGAISMASTGDGVPGSAEFFICDGARTGLDGRYAAFGKTIYGIEVVRDIANDPHDSRYEPSPGGGKPNTDIIINTIKMVKE